MLTHAQSDIKNECFDLAAGESRRIVCPSCHRPERTCAVTRCGTGLLYHCFRASCPAKGFIPSIGSALVGQPGKRKPKSNPYSRELVSLPAHVVERIQCMYELSSAQLGREGWMWNAETGRVVMPIKDFYGRTLGHNARHWEDVAGFPCEGPKAITYWDSPDCGKYHFAGSGGGPLVLVEDMVSATVLSDYVDCVAMLGTNLTLPLVRAALDAGYDTAVLSLDADAAAKAIKVAMQCSLYFKTFKVVTLDGPDIKDMDLVELSDYLGRINRVTGYKDGEENT